MNTEYVLLDGVTKDDFVCSLQQLLNQTQRIEKQLTIKVEETIANQYVLNNEEMRSIME